MWFFNGPKAPSITLISDEDLYLEGFFLQAGPGEGKNALLAIALFWDQQDMHMDHSSPVLFFAKIS